MNPVVSRAAARDQDRRGSQLLCDPRCPRPNAPPFATAVEMANGEALAARVAQAAEAFSGLDAVVANVIDLAIPDTEANWQLSLKVDVTHTVRAALPHRGIRTRYLQ